MVAFGDTSAIGVLWDLYSSWLETRANGKCCAV